MLPQNKIPPAITEYVNATSLEMALEALADGNGTPLAGGSDLWAQKDNGDGRIGSRLVNLNRIDELRGISVNNGFVRIGALTSMSEILENQELAGSVALLPKVADRFASDQIRNVATVGGNIANASPAADFVLPLVALDSEVEICSNGRDPRKQALSELFTGPGKTSLGADELITAVTFRIPQMNFHGVFCKTGPRPALEISLVAMCLTGELHNGILDNSRLVFGAVGPTVIGCANTENLINGAQIDDKLIAEALDMMAGEISPITDVRASKWYRTHIARTFLEQELIACRSK